MNGAGHFGLCRSNGIPMKVGQLWGRFRNGRESMSFEYDRNSAKVKIKKVEFDRMASAFEYEDLQKVLR